MHRQYLFTVEIIKNLLSFLCNITMLRLRIEFSSKREKTYIAIRHTLIKINRYAPLKLFQLTQSSFNVTFNSYKNISISDTSCKIFEHIINCSNFDESCAFFLLPLFHKAVLLNVSNRAKL